jgi:hypothetical protein
MPDESIWKTPAQRRHALRVAWASAAYAVLLIVILAFHVLRPAHVTSPWRLLLALLTAVPLVGMFVSYARYLSEETDEYLRMLVMRNFVTATMIAMTCADVCGFLTELGGVLPIATYWIAILWIVAQLVSATIARARSA